MAFEVTPTCAKVKIVSREKGTVKVNPRRKKVAFVGFASNSLHMVPWEDPEFELWGMNQGAANFKRQADRWFEMHLPEATPDIRDPNYMQWLKDLQIPVYMVETYPYAPTGLRYPIERAIAYAGRDYFMSSVAFMCALAGMEDFEEIHLYGINLAIGDEYFYEKPNAEWWLGKLEALGKKIYIPRASSLLKQQKRYGYEIDARPNQSLKILLGARENEYKARVEKIQAEANQINGHIIAFNEIAALPEGHVEHAKQKVAELTPVLQNRVNEGNQFLGAMREAQSLSQIFEGVDAGADIVLVPQVPTPPTTTTST